MIGAPPFLAPTERIGRFASRGPIIPGNTGRARAARRVSLGVLSILPGAAVILGACASDMPTVGKEPVTDDRSQLAALTLRYIQRLPEIPWVWGSTDPTREGWPAPGQAITWRAVVKNWFGREETVVLAWKVDDTEVGRDTLVIPPSSERTAELAWRWTFERHRIAAVLDPDNVLEEDTELNNRVEVFSDALAIGFWVEQGQYDFYRAELARFAWATSFDDFAQSKIQRLNTLLAGAVYPETPEGVLDRVRLDRVVVVPSGSLPSVAQPAPDDRTVDIQWGFLAAHVSTMKSPDGFRTPSFDHPALEHELGHARYLIDVYLWDLQHDTASPVEGRFVNVREAGEPIAGSRYLPVLAPVQGGGVVLHRTRETGLMSRDYSRLDRYSAIALNRIAGHRATRGSWNCPENCGEFLRDLPAENRLTLTDSAGTPLAGALVSVYQAETRVDGQGGAPPTYWRDWFDDTPDLQLVADPGGSVRLGRSPFGTQESWLGGLAGVPRWHAIIRVEHHGRVGNGVLESRTFNLAYWAGHLDFAEHQLAVELFDPQS